MKKSTLFVSLAIVSSIVTLAAVNLKIKSEYTRGRIESAYVQHKLPPFRFIAERVDSTEGMPYVPFEVIANDTLPAAYNTYYLRPVPLNYRVVNDTLFITSNAVTGERYMAEPVVITLPFLEGLSAERGIHQVKHSGKGALSIEAAKTSQVWLSTGGLNSLALSATDKASISLSSRTRIDSARIGIHQLSSLTVNNTIVGTKHLDIDSTATLKLTGRSIDNFGIGNR